MSLTVLRSAIAMGTSLAVALSSTVAIASSHMDAPLITLDDPANTTDVYAFRSQSENRAVQYLTTALSVYPFEEPGIGPNNYRFDDNVLYEIHVALDEDIQAGRPTLTYQFRFQTEFLDQTTIRQAFLGEVLDVFGENQNMRQSYAVTKIDHRYEDDDDGGVLLGSGLVPPNNQGLVTPFYNQNDDGEMPAKEGVSSKAELDRYTQQAIADLDVNYQAFAGQRDDAFNADIQSIFDLDFSFGRDPLLAGLGKPFDSQGGFNVHTIVFNVPLSELEGAKLAGVYATTSRNRVLRLSKDFEKKDDKLKGDFIQVARQGNPVFNEALVALADKDLYNRVGPDRDEEIFAQYAEDTEIGALLNIEEIIPGLVRSIYIPDMIKVDLTTGPARLAGQEGFDRLGVFGGDVLKSQFQDPFGNGGFIPGGWPNGRRFGDDVVDIALIALGAAGPADPNEPGFGFTEVEIDGVTENEITFNDVFPYAATPLNGRNHGHHGGPADSGEAAFE